MSRYEVEGKVVFDREAPTMAGESCRQQCGSAGHIKRRSLVLDSAGADLRSAFVRSPADFIHERVLKDNGNEGRRVRITVEVLD